MEKTNSNVIPNSEDNVFLQLFKQKATQGNLLIRSNYSYTYRELKLSRLIISEISPQDTEKDIITISREKLFTFLKPTDKKQGALHKDLKKIIKGLNQKPIEIVAKNKKAVIYWVGAHGNDMDTDTFWFEIPKSIHPFLFALKGNFSSIPLHVYDLFRSPYPARMYEILYSYRNMKGREVVYPDWKSLQNQLGGKHDTYSNFKASILNQCQKQLEERTDLRFEYEEIKKAKTRGVKGLKLFVFYNKKPESTIPKKEEYSLFSIADYSQKDSENIKTIEKTLTGWGISPHTVQECIYDPFLFIKDEPLRKEALDQYKESKIDYIWDKMEYTISSETVKDEASFFLAAIRNNYRNKKQKAEKVAKIKHQRKNQSQQRKMELEQELNDFSDRYYNVIFKIMDGLLKDEQGYSKRVLNKVKENPHNGFNTKYSLEENLDKTIMFRFSVLAQVKQDYPEHFQQLEAEFDKKKKAIMDEMNGL